MTAAGVATPTTRYRLTLPEGAKFPDGTSSKVYVTEGEAVAQNTAKFGGRGSIEKIALANV